MAAALDASSLAGFRLRLEERRSELKALIEDGHRADQPVSPDRAIGRLTRQDALQQQEMSAELIRRYERELVQVQKALGTIDEGTYGLCQRCGEPIASARLNAMLHASRCVQCADQQSKSRG